MNELTPPGTLPGYKDRSAGLVIFGVLTMLLGGVFALFIPFMILGQALSQRTTGIPGDFKTIVPAILFYAVLSVAFVWLGIGSFLARRWARALLLIAAWAALLTGLIGIGMMVALFPQLAESIRANQPPGQPPLPPAAAYAMVGIGMGMIGFGLLIVPGLWILFYRSPHVRATCEARNPAHCWTDACPLPVLALSMGLAYSALMMLAMPFVYRGVLPVFGVFLSGWPGFLGYLLLAAVWAYAAGATYRLESRGWWLTTVALGLLMLSSGVTYSTHELSDFYREIGYSDQQLEQLKKVGLVNGRFLFWSSLASVIPLGGYMMYVKRFFVRG